MNFAEADYVMTNTPGMLTAMGRMMTELGVKPEIEAFDTGHLWYAKQLVKDGVLDSPALVQLCMGVPWGAPDDLNTFMAMVNNVPDDWTFSAFGLGRNQMAYVAAACWRGAMCASGLRTTCGWTRACWPKTGSWSNAPAPSSKTWAHG